MELISFDEAYRRASGLSQNLPSLLLGNGFSIAFDPSIFTYDALLQMTDFSSDPTAKDAFAALSTKDFEEVIRSLDIGSTLTKNYLPYGPEIADRMRVDSEFLKQALISAILKRHPAHIFKIPAGCYNSTARFITKFSEVFTVNYDLLLYWTLINSQALRSCRDGFRESEFTSGIYEWRDTSRDSPGWRENLHFLHGGLHLFERNGILSKVTYSVTSGHLIEQIKMNIEQGSVPLFVCEGTSEEKLDQIQRHTYLRYCLSRFGKAGPVLFTFGISFSLADEHIVDRIFNRSFQHLYVGVFGDPDNDGNTGLRSKLIERASASGIDVEFYASGSIGLWEDSINQ